MEETKEHWEKIYKTKDLKEVSWYQEKPRPSLNYIQSLELDKDAAIIDVGGGDSFLADHLLAEGYSNITVLDISEEAINRAKKRLGKKAGKITWITADAGDLKLKESYDLWHDRAAFHFLTAEEKIENYLKSMKAHVKKGGYVILGTFSEKGPEKCSGIKIKQYSLHEMADLFVEDFEIVDSENIDHITPTEAIQNFSFGIFKKL
ncbi:class I SAM-dependent methyltransferase [Antarcticibacterium flavum]|uniref:Class I SAM-dependent methyltransferase n=1 Tax=Antarcticibacterium flavum TaxID=2058175 RepID=A0A5B7X6Z4_9FLAO|nr:MULTISPECIES: class I SAM-dependent methyltransferase [Antarcticibacterium]MCM4160683.1 SAM-dependent methyltransferase [Antarcticibacterium sp. W02-3]QCY71169.1 class I SAM-dependent methyltransferase [Antarcticibacterium flavum]